jgi:hypothetical protein
MTRHQLAAHAAQAWNRYDTVCRAWGDPRHPARQLAWTQALKNERALAAYDYQNRPAPDREAIARTLSGA